MYRCKSFDDILGNQETIKLLKSYSELNESERPHSYLLYGSHGCGKTTLARILANQYNCEIVELNNSNNRGIDTIRDVIYRGAETGNLLSKNKNKAFILDESHQLPSLSQDALLKILEEPPLHVYFFLCTTEPNRLKGTIHSRCTQIKVEKIKTRSLYPYLISISKKEGNEISKKVARKICDITEGHVRDALNILQKVVQFDDEQKQLEVASEIISKEAEIIDLCRLLLKNTFFSQEIKKLLIKLKNQNPESIRQIIINYMVKVLLDGGDENKAAIIIDNLREPCYEFSILCVNLYQIYL